MALMTCPISKLPVVKGRALCMRRTCCRKRAMSDLALGHAGSLNPKTPPSNPKTHLLPQARHVRLGPGQGACQLGALAAVRARAALRICLLAGITTT